MPKSATRQLGLPGFELGDYIQESIDFLRQNEPAEGYFVGFSGGKDSIVTLELCRIAGVRHKAFYSCTRIDAPEMYSFIKTNYPDVKWLFPKESFWSLLLKKGPPFRMRRWCCDKLKKDPSRDIPLKYRIMGIRAEESTRRARRPRISKYNGKQIIVKPIFFWPEWTVWEFIESRHLAYPSLYDEGLGRIGCVVCPFMFSPSENKQRQIAYSQKRWPGIWKVFEQTVKKWFVKKGLPCGGAVNKRIATPENFWKIYLRGGKEEEKINE